MSSSQRELSEPRTRTIRYESDLFALLGLDAQHTVSARLHEHSLEGRFHERNDPHQDIHIYRGTIPMARTLRDYLTRKEGKIIMSYPDTAENRRIFGHAPFRYKRLRFFRAFGNNISNPKGSRYWSELLVFNYNPERAPRWRVLKELRAERPWETTRTL